MKWNMLITEEEKVEKFPGVTAKSPISSELDKKDKDKEEKVPDKDTQEDKHLEIITNLLEKHSKTIISDFEQKIKQNPDPILVLIRDQGIETTLQDFILKYYIKTIESTEEQLLLTTYIDDLIQILVDNLVDYFGKIGSKKKTEE